ncbi:MAG TPA: hypothetical protein VHT75_17525, partial [Acidimicrobiales bacterium]|nr:hypothetical protein [Acidimicrobiales bacterium]
MTLAAGFFTRTPAFIYASIVCSALAAVGLVLSSRRRGPGAKGEDLSWPASLAETDRDEATAPHPVLGAEAPAGHAEAPEPVFASAGAGPTRRRSAPSGGGPVPPDSNSETSQFAAPATTDGTRRRSRRQDGSGQEGSGQEAEAAPRSSRKRNPVAADWVQPSASAPA